MDCIAYSILKVQVFSMQTFPFSKMQLSFKDPTRLGARSLVAPSETISDAELGNLTPNGYCKEDGCNSSVLPATGRVHKHVPICPIPSSEDNLYVIILLISIFIDHSNNNSLQYLVVRNRNRPPSPSHPLWCSITV